MRIIELERKACEGQQLILSYDSYAVWEAVFENSEESSVVRIERKKTEKKHAERTFDLLCRADSRVLGLLDDTGLRGIAEISGGKEREPARLETLCIFEGYRRRGYGTLLLNRAKEKVRLSGSGALTVRVPFDNSGAVSFLQGQGFVITGYDPAPARDFASGLFMTCVLH